MKALRLTVEIQELAFPSAPLMTFDNLRGTLVTLVTESPIE